MLAKLLVFLILLLIFVLGLSFAVENAHTVRFNYFVGTFEVALSALLVLTLLAGVFLGALVSVVPVLRMKGRIRSLSRSEAVAREEIRNLRTMPLKDSP